MRVTIINSHPARGAAPDPRNKPKDLMSVGLCAARTSPPLRNLTRIEKLYSPVGFSAMKGMSFNSYSPLIPKISRLMNASGGSSGPQDSMPPPGSRVAAVSADTRCMPYSGNPKGAQFTCIHGGWRYPHLCGE